MSTPPSPYPGQFPPGQPGDRGNSQHLPPGQPLYAPGGSHLQGGYGYAPPGRYAEWPIRVGASLIDTMVQFPPVVIGFIAGMAINGDSKELEPAAGTAMVLGVALSGVFWFWNRVIKQGRSGQSVGKRVTGIRRSSRSGPVRRSASAGPSPGRSARI